MNIQGDRKPGAEEFYNTIADSYDSGKKKNLYYFQNLVSLYRSYIPAQSTITEVGSGTGDLITHLEAKEAVGYDISEAMVGIARRKYAHLKNIRYERHNIFDSSEPFSSKYIILADVLEHVDDLEKFLIQLSKCAPRDSTVIISVLNPIWEWLMVIVEKLNMKIPEGPHKRFTVKETEKLFEKAGFRLKERGYRLLIPKKIPLSGFINNRFYRNRFLARFGFTVYWVLTANTFDHDSDDRVSFVFPVYNEQYTIERTLRDYYNEFKGKLDFEMIVAEDGSTDRTKEIIKRLENELPLRIYMDSRRKGYRGAIKDALRHPKNKWIFLVDSDHQFDPHDFWKLWPHIDKYDLILGRKVDRQDGPIRAFLSKGYNLLLKIFFWKPYWDMDTGFRLLKRGSINDLVPTIDKLGYFTAELVIKADDRGLKILEVPVKHFKQESRSSNIFHISKLPKIIMTELKGIWKLFLEIRLNRRK